MSARASIVWFRQDLRLEDHPALGAAVQRGGPIIPVFIWSPEEEGAWTPGAASRWWLRRSLMRLNADLRQRGSQLSIRRGDSTAILQALVRETGAAAVFWDRRYEPTAVDQERAAETRLRPMGLTAESFNAGLLVEPGEVRARSGKPYQVFTPLWKACLSREDPQPPLPAPEKLTAPSLWPESLPLEELCLEPTIDWAAGLRRVWTPGEEGARAQLQYALDEVLLDYPERRDRPDVIGTSRLSPHLHFGEIGPRQIWHAVEAYAARHVQRGVFQAASAYRRQLYWREFAHHVLWHFPHTADQPLRPEFAAFP
jgi:deoxyribodipyrimidine photo-lyase